MTGTFVRPGTLRSSTAALRRCPTLASLALTSTPAARWPCCRAYVIVRLPHVTRLDGAAVTPGERITAAADAGRLADAARAEQAADRASRGTLARHGGDTDSDDGGSSASDEEEADAALAAARAAAAAPGARAAARAWSRVTRIVDAILADEDERAAEGVPETPVACVQRAWPRARGNRTALPPLPEGDRLPPQCNEGEWPFTVIVVDGGGWLEIEVALRVRNACSLPPVLDLQPLSLRLLHGGDMLCLRLPGAVDPGAGGAARSAATGTLVVRAPLADPGAPLDASCLRPKEEDAEKDVGASGRGSVVSVCAGGGDAPPPLAG